MVILYLLATIGVITSRCNDVTDQASASGDSRSPGLHMSGRGSTTDRQDCKQKASTFGQTTNSTDLTVCKKRQLDNISDSYLTQFVDMVNSMLHRVDPKAPNITVDDLDAPDVVSAVEDWYVNTNRSRLNNNRTGPSVMENSSRSSTSTGGVSQSERKYPTNQRPNSTNGNRTSRRYCKKVWNTMLSDLADVDNTTYPQDQEKGNCSKARTNFETVCYELINLSFSYAEKTLDAIFTIIQADAGLSVDIFSEVDLRDCVVSDSDHEGLIAEKNPKIITNLTEIFQTP